MKWHSGSVERIQNTCSVPHLLIDDGICLGDFVPNIVEEMITDWIINVQTRVRFCSEKYAEEKR